MLSPKEPSKSNDASLSGITRSYALFICLLVLANLLYGYNYVNAYINSKQTMLSAVADQLQKRIETYRFVTYQIYDNLSASNSVQLPSPVNEIRLRPDIYLLEKSRHKTDALIFGLHDVTTSDLAMRMSNYLDILWGAETETYSMYYLNGQDNSLILISTMPMKDLSARYKEGYLGNVVESRKAEMLQQSNSLDEREGFSGLRKFRFLNSYYFTLRTTFNNPGHLATVVAFDLPVGDILPRDLPVQRFQITENPDSLSEMMSREEIPAAYTTLRWPWLTISAPLYNTPLKVDFNVPATTLIVDMLRNNFWLLLINLLVLALSFTGFYFVRHQYIRPGKRMAAQLSAQQEMNQEIITHLPIGLLIYRFDTDTVVASNKIADHLLPHLSLSKIASMAQEHQGRIQATVNNEMYEIQMVRSQQNIKSALFLMRDLDKEMMVSKKLKQAQSEYEKNLTARKIMTSNLSRELNDPLSNIQKLVTDIQNNKDDPRVLDLLWAEARHAQVLINEITLLTEIENRDWRPVTETFNLNKRIDELLKRSLPEIRRKGLTLINHTDIEPEREFIGDIRSLEQVLSMLLHYSIITTVYGKITLKVTQKPESPDHLYFELSDTGTGVSNKEIYGLRYPNLGEPQSDRFAKGSGMTYYLCGQLCKRMSGRLDIQSKDDIGTRYNFNCIMHPVEKQEEESEKLLDGITAYLQITSDEIRSLITHKLAAFGAASIIADGRDANEEYDITLTDSPENAEDYTLLLVSDIDGFEEYAPHRIKANFNLTEPLIDAILLLIEQQIAVTESPIDTDYAENEDPASDSTPFKSKDYFSLFVETVPEDVQKLYTEAEQSDLSPLSLTAHRLKGVFAMLNIPTGKTLCEQLEHAIKESDVTNIKILISQIDTFVSRLLLLGSQQHE